MFKIHYDGNFLMATSSEARRQENQDILQLLYRRYELFIYLTNRSLSYPPAIKNLQRRSAIMEWFGLSIPDLRFETRFGDRVVPAFPERPHSLWQMLEDAAAHRPEGEALVCGEERLT